jgi:DNA phosphorothioation-dependent restriction protein DptH
VVIASQDPLSGRRAVIELTSILILHRMTSPQWLKHLENAISALDDVSDAQLAALRAGEALTWTQRLTDKRFSQRPYRIQIRPRVSLHGGGTKTAGPDATVK